MLVKRFPTMATVDYQRITQPIPGTWGMGGHSPIITLNVIRVLVAVAENYEAALSDAIVSVPAPPTPGSSLEDATNDLTSLMTYFYYGMQRSFQTCTRTPANTLELNQLGNLLDSIRIDLLLLRFLTPMGPVPTYFPNRDVVELLVKIKFYGGAAPATVGALFDILSQTALAQLQRQHGGGVIWSSGLPAVVFPCLGHSLELVVGVSTPTWSGYQKVWNRVRAWRDGRFANPGFAVADIQNAGALVVQKFNDFCVANPVLATTYRDPALRLQATAAQWNTVINTIFALLFDHGNGAPYAFDHAGELARSFHARGQTIFSPMSRCWKCRFLHLYRVNDAIVTTVARESPAGTAFAANEPRSCAEDLCHYFCSQLLSGTAAVQLPAVPILP